MSAGGLPSDTLDAGSASPLHEKEQQFQDRKANAATTTSGGARAWVEAFVKFTRPHTMFGTAVSVSSVSLLALGRASDLNGTFVLGVLTALSSALAMNVSIVGLNQVYDIEIDRVNKPYLPLASGEFTKATGKGIVIASALVSLAIGEWPWMAERP